jgi:hypothetical protein
LAGLGVEWIPTLNRHSTRARMSHPQN